MTKTRMLLCNMNILCIGGMDPAGAAGVLTDARMLESLGGHTSALITCHTSQSRRHHFSSSAVPLALLRQQWQNLLRDMPIHGVKIGAVANLAQAQWLATVLPSLSVPIVFDPVLLSSSGGQLGLSDAARQLMPAVTLATPNRQEVVQLYGNDWHDKLAGPTLITGSDTADDQPSISHHLLDGQIEHHWQVTRRPGQYRGTGCLLSSAVTAYLVAGYPLIAACSEALALVDQWLACAWQFSDGVHIPRPPA